MFICFDSEESSKQFVQRSDIKSYKDNEMLVLSRYVVVGFCGMEEQLLEITKLIMYKYILNN